MLVDCCWREAGCGEWALDFESREVKAARRVGARAVVYGEQDNWFG